MKIQKNDFWKNNLVSTLTKMIIFLFELAMSSIYCYYSAYLHNFMFSFWNYTQTKMILFAGAFELAMIRMSRYFDVGQNAVLFLDTMLPMDAFMTTGDSAEMNLVNQIFDFVKILAEVQLSETALALFSAYILLQEGQY